MSQTTIESGDSRVDSRVKRGNHIHKKTGTVYWVITTCKNATNANEGEVVVIYFKDEMYVREINEFLEKFVPAE